MKEEDLPSTSERGSETRQKLLVSSVEVFGRNGYDAATTRMLAETAGVNLQAINYYFGDKEGLYLAVARHIAASIDEEMTEVRRRIVARCIEAETCGPPLEDDEARALIAEVLKALAGVFTSGETEFSARFLMREMTSPTNAFDHIYAVTGSGMKLIDRLLAIILRKSPESEEVRLRTVSLIGSLMMFRLTRATVMRHLDWDTIGEREAGLIRNLAAELAATVRASGISRDDERGCQTGY